MIVYLDASALVKRYVRESGSSDVNSLLGRADAVGTGLISRAEVTAALAKAARVRSISGRSAESALQSFRAQWPNLIRLQITEALMARADSLAWEHGLRGYDAVHLAAAVFWEEALGESVHLATFDRELWEAGSRLGMRVWPGKLEGRM